MSVDAEERASDARADARDGVRDILPAALAAVPIGFLYGALCTAKGLSPLETALMSALVFAGGAQFAAVELWSVSIPIGALAFSTLLINARHVLMGASLAAKLGAFSRRQRLLGLFFMADENWALSERRAAWRRLTPAYWFAMAGLFWANWVAWSLGGALAGALLGDPRRFGADFAFTALFIGLIASFWQGRASASIVAASLGASALVHVGLGSPWHVAAGALAGIATAYARAEEEPA